MDEKMNEKILLISEILSMDFKQKRINDVLKILDKEIELLEERIDNLAQKEDLTSEEQKELLLLGKHYDQEKDLLITTQNLMKQKKKLTKNKKKLNLKQKELCQLIQNLQPNKKKKNKKKLTFENV
jgi:hypothetical protein